MRNLIQHNCHKHNNKKMTLIRLDYENTPYFFNSTNYIQLCQDFLLYYYNITNQVCGNVNETEITSVMHSSPYNILLLYTDFHFLTLNLPFVNFKQDLSDFNLNVTVFNYPESQIIDISIYNNFITTSLFWFILPILFALLFTLFVVWACLDRCCIEGLKNSVMRPADALFDHGDDD